jgi:hypothetical protein
MSRLATALIGTKTRRLPFARRLSRELSGPRVASSRGPMAIAALALAVIWLAF